MPPITFEGIAPGLSTESFFKMAAAGVGALGNEYELGSPSPGVLTIVRHKKRARFGLVGLLAMSPRETITIVASEREEGVHVVINGTGTDDLVGFLDELVSRGDAIGRA